MLGLSANLALPDVAVIAPEASGHWWWPASFLAPLEGERAGLSSGISVVVALLDELGGRGIEAERIVLGGFSQGACLGLEAAARLARPFHTAAHSGEDRRALPHGRDHDPARRRP